MEKNRMMVEEKNNKERTNEEEKMKVEARKKGEILEI
jgi:hypothetical protein